jgi:hypothetical protein
VSIDPDSGATIPEDATAPFPNPGETAMDIDAQAQSRVLTQYRESPNLKGTISDHAELFQDLEDCSVNISKQRDPAIAEGVNLDVIGVLVGQSRVLTTGVELADADYRDFIALRIARNHSIGSGPEFVAALEAVLDPTPFRFVDLGGMAVLIELATGAPPTDDQIALLDYGPTPRAMAVGVSRAWYDPDDYFGFEEDPRPGRKGFGLTSDPSLGGKMGMRF